MRKLFRNLMLVALIAALALTLTACGWVGKLTEENFKKVDSTMTYADVKEVLGKANKEFDNNGDVYLVNYDASKNTNEKQDMIEGIIWFGQDGKVTKVEAKRFTTPPNGGLQTIVWEVNYTA